MKILLLSRYSRLGASSRIRSFQYLPYLEKRGCQVDVSPLFSDDYLHALYGGQPRTKQVLHGYWNRIKSLLQVGKYDLIWIEYEIFPFMPALFERLLNLTRIPYVVDYDDALFHRYDMHHNRLIRSLLGKKIDTVMRNASLVIAGNEYLAERARKAGAKQVEIIPTVVDLERYSLSGKVTNQPLIIGWIGSPSTSRYLLSLKSVFKTLKKQFDVRFVAVGAKSVDLPDVPIECWPWSETTEVESILKFDIGIMPLTDTPWERGKCGYKLIQYMACGVPVVASPVGVNKQIVQHGENGFLANDLSEWEEMLSTLLQDYTLRGKMGGNGRERVESNYSLQVQAPRLESLLRQIVEE